MWRRAALLAAHLEQPNNAARALPCAPWSIGAATTKRQRTLGRFADKMLVHFCGQAFYPLG